MRSAADLFLATITILLSWAFTHTIFALHYAHEYYDRTAGGMAFPGEEREPDYWDFVYFSFVIGMTSQVSDVGVTSKEIRRTVIAYEEKLSQAKADLSHVSAAITTFEGASEGTASTPQDRAIGGVKTWWFRGRSSESSFELSFDNNRGEQSPALRKTRTPDFHLLTSWFLPARRRSSVG